MKRMTFLCSRTIISLAALVLAVQGFALSSESKPLKEFFPKLPEGQTFKLVWNDEFDGDKLDAAKWETPEGPRRDGFWSSDTITLDGKGNLLLNVIEKDGKYYDGCIRTRGRFEHSYGYYVIRAKMHTQEGHWPAFWLYNASVGNLGNGGTDGAEIDIFEKPWRDLYVNQAVHWDGYGKEHEMEATKVIAPGVMKGYHTFALLWTKEEYVFYIDGKVSWRTKGGGICTVPLYIKVSDEIGDWAGDIKKAKLPDASYIDYVRVYDIVEK